MAVTAALGGGRARHHLLPLVAMLLVGLVGPVALPTPVSAAPARAGLVTGWLPHWASSDALAAVESNADLFSEASPFWYTARASGGSTSVSLRVDEAAVAAAVASLHSRGIAVLPSVADGSAARAMAAILKDPVARAAHAAQLVDLVMANGFDGLELDYEKFAYSDGRSTWAETRPAWVAFIGELGSALRTAGKRLALAVPPTYDGNRSSTSGYWVYDYQGVAPWVDSLRIMTYDFSVSRPGPISPLAFLHKSLSYAVTAFPPGRIRMGVPAYGRLWTARRADGSLSITGTCPTSGVPGTTSFTTDTALSYLTSMAGSEPALRFDEPSAEMVATFSRKYSGKDTSGAPTSCVVDHEAWWVDARGVAARLPLVEQYGLAGVAMWHLGGVDADSWSVLHGNPLPLPPPPAPEAGLTVTAPATVVRGDAATVTVDVVAQQPVPQGTPVVLRRRSRGSSTWRAVGTSPTDATGMAAFAVPRLTRTTDWRARARVAAGEPRLEATATTRVAFRVAATPSTTSPAPKERVKVRVAIRPRLKGVLIRRQMLVDGSWRTLARKRTGAKGRVTFRVRWPTSPTSNTYRVVAKRTAGYAKGVSETFVISTRS